MKRTEVVNVIQERDMAMMWLVLNDEGGWISERPTSYRYGLFLLVVDGKLVRINPYL